MSAYILTLPNEVLITISAGLPTLADLTALARTCRRLNTIARSELLARIPGNPANVRNALFYFAENGLLEPARQLLDLGVNPNVVYCSPIPRDSYLRLLAAQGRRPGRRPLLDRLFAREYLDTAINTCTPGSDLGLTFRRLRNSPLLHSTPNTRFAHSDEYAYNLLIQELHAVVVQHDVVWDPKRRRINKSDGSNFSPEELGSLYLWTPLHVAAHRGDDAFIRLLIQRGANLNPYLRVHHKLDFTHVIEPWRRQEWIPLNESPLLQAVIAGHLSTVQLLLKEGASRYMVADPPEAHYHPNYWNNKPGYGITPLHVAAWHGHLPLCEFLADWDPKLVTDGHNITLMPPTEYAIAGGHLKTTGRFLLEKHVDLTTPPDSPDRKQKTLLQLSSERQPIISYALRSRKQWSDVSWLVDMRVGLGPHDIRPPLFWVTDSTVTGADEEDPDMIPILRRLAFDSTHRVQMSQHDLDACMDAAARKHMPQTLRLLMELAHHRSLKVISGHRLNLIMTYHPLYKEVSPDRVLNTVKQLIDHGLAAKQIQVPTIFSWFQDNPFNPIPIHSVMVPRHIHFCLATPGMAAAKLAVAQYLYELNTRNPDIGIDVDLRASLLSVCQPGGLPLCQWLASVGALRTITKSDLAIMLTRTAMSERFGGVDVDLARWVLEQADVLGVKKELLAEIDVGLIISTSGDLAIPHLLLSHGARPTGSLAARSATSASLGHGMWACRAGRRLDPRNLHITQCDHAALMACLRPDFAQAHEVLRLALDQAPKDLVSTTLLYDMASRRYVTMASLVCCTHSPTPQPPHTPVLESQRLAMLQILINHGADVHEVFAKHDPPDLEFSATEHYPSNALLRAFASEDTDEIFRLQDPQHPRFRPADAHRPVICAIQGLMPSLVKLMLESQPLKEPNSRTALRYLKAACSGAGARRLSPACLKHVLDLANITDADLHTDEDGRTGLMCLLSFFKEDDYAEDTPDMTHRHPCRCEPELVGFEKDDLCNMISMLLERGAKWTTKAELLGISPLDLLKDVFADGAMARKGMYKQHNVIELRKRVMLDIWEKGVEKRRGFNPFEMGNVKVDKGEEPVEGGTDGGKVLMRQEHPSVGMGRLRHVMRDGRW
jgi:hypothetical protein